jgi:hypothetical protein
MIIKYTDDILNRLGSHHKKKLVELEFYIASNFWKSSSM